MLTIFSLNLFYLIDIYKSFVSVGFGDILLVSMVNLASPTPQFLDDFRPYNKKLYKPY